MSTKCIKGRPSGAEQDTTLKCLKYEYTEIYFDKEGSTVPKAGLHAVYSGCA